MQIDRQSNEYRRLIFVRPFDDRQHIEIVVNERGINWPGLGTVSPADTEQFIAGLEAAQDEFAKLSECPCGLRDCCKRTE